MHLKVCFGAKPHTHKETVTSSSGLKAIFTFKRCVKYWLRK